MGNLIEFKNVSFAYNGETTTLDDISFSIQKGEYVSLVGHNGSGKSTLAKLIVGLVAPKNGEIYIDNVLLNKDSVLSIRKKIALVFQNPDNQFIGNTVEEDIAFGLENMQVEHGEMIKLVHEFAEKVGMKEYLKQEPINLSGGQKQRVAIAGALILNPEIIIFDEATSMLDPKGRREIRELIKSMKDANPGLTVISITHDIEEAFNSERVIVLNKGKIVANGNPKEVLSNQTLMNEIGLRVPFVLQLINAINDKRIDKEIKDIDSLVDKLWQLK